MESIANRRSDFVPNYNVFNNTDGPLYTQQVNTYIVPGIDSTPESSASGAGILYIATFSSSITAAQNLIMQIANPGGSGKTVYISAVSGSISIAGATVTLSKNGTVTGSTVTPVNLNFGSSNLSVMTARTATRTVTGATTVASLLLAAGPFVLTFTGSVIVPAGSSFTVAIGVGAATASANVTWWEY